MNSGRFTARTRTMVAFLVVIALGAGAASVWRAASSDDRGPERLTLEQLVFGQEDSSGRRVRTGGVVQRFGPEDGALSLHYVIDDEADNRVRLNGGDPARFVGQAVQVVGRFRLTETSGRTIDVEQIERAEPLERPGALKLGLRDEVSRRPSGPIAERAGR